ncbi:CDP-glycerol glycerophosphotransferase family protein [Vibrio campbellii]|uniref:CDP-glycerol glycerophosphotransferase family protein n=1 Tax=Vibrio campbellii TaxID=680 RepID=UPI00385737D5
MINWILNITLNILRLKKRSPNLLVFGAWNGEKYADNSRYLFEYLKREYPLVRTVWITKNDQVKEKLNSQGYECYIYNETNGIKARLNCGYVFFTNGINDVGRFDLTHGAIKVALWHGMPLKKMGYATNNLMKRNKNIFRALQYLYLKIYNPSQRDVSIATSIKTKELMCQAFHAKPIDVHITGQPRNDVLFSEGVKSKVNNELGHDEGKKFILYLPTWRDFGKEDLFLKETTLALINDISFMESLKLNGIFLYVKPHPRVELNIKSNGNIRVVDDDFPYDTQELLSSSDMLITDYSSAFIDYALLKKPIFFYTPDLDEYKKTGNDLFLDFDRFSSSSISNVEDLKRTILSAEETVKGIDNSRLVNLIFNDSSLVDGEYCKKVIEVMTDYYGLILKNDEII